jgi:hypothetical protein
LVIANVRRAGINQTRRVADGKTGCRGIMIFAVRRILLKTEQSKNFYLKRGNVDIKRRSASSFFRVQNDIESCRQERIIEQPGY